MPQLNHRIWRRICTFLILGGLLGAWLPACQTTPFADKPYYLTKGFRSAWESEYAGPGYVVLDAYMGYEILIMPLVWLIVPSSGSSVAGNLLMMLSTWIAFPLSLTALMALVYGVGSLIISFLPDNPGASHTAWRIFRLFGLLIALPGGLCGSMAIFQGGLLHSYGLVITLAGLAVSVPLELRKDQPRRSRIDGSAKVIGKI